ncbi:MAG: hypothetical protein ABIU30_21115, partial [Ferruginibacter sp.]
FGNILVASTPKGICHMAFAADEQTGLQVLQQKFPNATFKQMTDLIFSRMHCTFLQKIGANWMR